MVRTNRNQVKARGKSGVGVDGGQPALRKLQNLGGKPALGKKEKEDAAVVGNKQEEEGQKSSQAKGPNRSSMRQALGKMNCESNTKSWE